MSTSVVQVDRLEDRYPFNVIVVSPNAQLRQELEEKLVPERWCVFQAGSGAGALELLRKHESSDGVLLLDPMLPDLEPDGFRAIVGHRFPNTQVLMLNSQTGQLLVGSASPTPVSAKRMTTEASSAPAAIVNSLRSEACMARWLFRAKFRNTCNNP